ncbi:hypothetical protein CaCOL14_006607 [Colletotrichum acutatum]
MTATIDELRNFKETIEAATNLDARYLVRRLREYVPSIVTNAMNRTERSTPNTSPFKGNNTAMPQPATPGPSSAYPPIGSPKPGGSPKSRNQRSVALTMERDGKKCCILGSMPCEAAHIFAFAASKYKSQIGRNLSALQVVFVQERIATFQSLLVKDLDHPFNLICLDHIPHKLLDSGKIALQPLPTQVPGEPDRYHGNGDYFIRIRLHFFGNNKLKDSANTPDKRKRRFLWEDNMAQDSYTFLSDDSATDDAANIRLVSFVNQRIIRDGHEFDVSAKEPGLLPSWALLDLVYRISLISHFAGAAGAFDNEYIDEYDQYPEKQGFFEDFYESQFEEEVDVVEGAIIESEGIARQRANQSGNLGNRDL